MHATSYPGADKSHWKGDGNATLATIDKIVLHTTEGTSLPAYTSSWPNLTYDPARRKWWQHTPINGSATSLQNDGQHQTNRANCVQVEIIGFARDAGNLPAAAIADLGAFVLWMHEQWEVPLVATAKWSGPDTVHRMTWPAYVAFAGVVGHQHVPGNNHWDPGRIDAAAIVDHAKAAHPWDGASFPGAAAFVIGRSHPAVTLLGRRLIVHDCARHFTQGSYQPGPTFSEIDRLNVRDFQLAQGWTGEDADGFPGAETWRRLMAEPRPATQPADVAFWVTQLNVLNPEWAKPGVLAWPRRLMLLTRALRAAKSSIIILNEVNAVTLTAIRAALGSKFSHHRLGHNAVLRDKTKWRTTGDIQAWLPGNGTRSLVAVALQRHGDGIPHDFPPVTIGAFHLEALSAGFAQSAEDAQRLRDEQATEVARQLGARRTLAGGDLNDTDNTSGPRRILRADGLLPLGDRVPVANLTLGTTDDHRHIDEIFTTVDLAVTHAEIVDVGEASDHNITRARVVVSPT